MFDGVPDNIYSSAARMCTEFSVRLTAYGIQGTDILAAFTRSIRQKTCFNDELVHTGKITSLALYKLWADEIGLAFDNHLDSDNVLLRPADGPESLSDIRHVLLGSPEGRSLLYMAPNLRELILLKDYIRRYPGLNERMRICTPQQLMQAIRKRHCSNTAKRAHSMIPDSLSASVVLNGWQGFSFGVGLFLLSALFILQAHHILFALYALVTLFFFCCVLIRLMASWNAIPLKILPLQPYHLHELPIYTVLVPLYREAGVVPQLIAALSAMNWPTTKLDIKLVCEADDIETLTAINAHILPSHFEVVHVPAIGPRTKPKALNYALHFARGAYVVVYDAEDRPHADQLLEAWEKFRSGPDNLACLQAPLLISNYGYNYLTRMFAFEYAGLFRGLLPWLADKNAVMPLGGTSNHLCRRALDEVGGWDSYNVTEDADLGMRLARFGYKVGVINRPTLEDAPEKYGYWKTQRTRWFKGWMQTWLVHMRTPVITCRQLGVERFSVYVVYTTGLLLSALIHPFMLLGLIVSLSLIALGFRDPVVLQFLLVDIANLGMAYFSSHLLGHKTLKGEERKNYNYLIGIPFYWIMLSYACWRALYQMFTAPHHWEKTPHFPSRTIAQPAE